MVVVACAVIVVTIADNFVGLVVAVAVVVAVGVATVHTDSRLPHTATRSLRPPTPPVLAGTTAVRILPPLVPLRLLFCRAALYV